MEIQINAIEKQAIQNLYSIIKDSLQVNKLIVFGSRARGEAEEYSDIDLLILTKRPKSFLDRATLADIAAEINVDYGVAINCIYFNESDWNNGVMINPLLKKNVEREGVTLDIQ